MTRQDDDSIQSKEIKAEAIAQQAVALLTKCLDELRTLDDLALFQPERIRLQIPDLIVQARALQNQNDNINANRHLPIESMRQVVVFQIFLPLFEILTCAYTTLDNMPFEPAIQKDGQRKPKPPLGMLSLRHYTDVACAMECTVILGILPHLEPHILLAVPERLKYQWPKSLAGRLPRRLLSQSQSASVTWPSTETNVSHRVLELDAVTQSVGQLILLDRFHPMLLPRHVTDLYAALFQANHDAPTTTLRLSWLQQSPIPTLLQAKTFQTLLVFGTQGPVWLRRTVSSYLTDLAVHDLSAIVQVFVMPDVDASAAAIRLAKTLQVSRNKGDNNDHLYFSSLLRQSFSFLSHLEFQDAGKVEAVVHTVWAILDIVPNDCWRMTMNVDVTSSGVLSQFHLLFSYIPPSSNPRRVVEWLWESSGDETIPSAWSLWWRIVVTSEVLYSPTIEKVKQLLRLVAVAWLEYPNAKKDDLLALRLIQALFPIPWDETFCLRVDQDIIRIENRDATTSEPSEVARLIERRTRAMIDTLMKSEDTHVRHLTSRFFVLMLKFYFSSTGIRASNIRLVPLVALPILCEELSLESLLLNDDDEDGIFEMMKLVFDCMTRRFKGEQEPEDGLLSHLDDDTIFQEMKYVGVDISHDIEIENDESSLETLFSVGLLLIGMLVSILELGSRARSKPDEEMLQSFRKPLQLFSRMLSDDDCDIPLSITTRMAEMSSHAVALLASRQISTSHKKSVVQSPADPVTQAEQDLQSAEPPMRARGVVTLRHLAADVNDATDRSKLSKVLQLTVSALADKESYVYLAAIHTLAAIADIAPSIVIPAVGRALASGVLNDNTLSEEQRIKLAEALISIIRRKAAIEEYTSFLMECMLWSSPFSSSTQIVDASTIQEQTHEYFIRPHDDDDEDGNNFEGQFVRLKTGGPLFKTEESDALRASFLQVVAELWGSVRSDTYTASVMDACRMSVSLETGRPVRRAGALLARQMYSKLLEQGDLDLARSMAAADEENLHNSLVRCSTLKDLHDLETKRLYDPATEARCREALALRQEVSELLEAGKLAWSVQIQEDQNPIVHLLREKSTTKNIPVQFLIKEID